MGAPYKVNVCYMVVTIDTENLSNLSVIEPGRIADHIDRGTFRLDKVQTMV
jgi:superfamily II DNA/RNA helicase